SRHHDVGADLEALLAVTEPAHADHLAVLLDELRGLGAHPALERREGGGLPAKRLQEDRLRHPDGVGVPRRDLLELELAHRPAVQANLPGLEKRVRLREHVLEEPELVQEVRRAWLQDLAPELALEVLV